MKERLEQRTYRRSPGRQYGYDYDPLRQNGGRGDASTSTTRTGSHLAQRPDLRRTRQLLRQSILASKSKSGTLPVDESDIDISSIEFEDGTPRSDDMGPPFVRAHRQAVIGDDQGMDEEYEGRDESQAYRNRRRTRDLERPREDISYSNHPYEPDARGLAETELEEDDQWQELDFVDPDIGYEDPVDPREGYAEPPPLLAPSRRRLPEYRQASRRPIEPAYPEYDEDQYEEDEYEEERVRPSARRKARKRRITRRKLLWGLGLGALAAGGVAAYELAPRIPQALNNVGTNIEKELQDAYNQGLAKGEEAVRKEFITALNDLEGISLQTAIFSAKLTREAYDAFVSPIVTLAATITGDFLNLALRALITARGWLIKIGQDNDTLAALQTVLQTWTQRVNELPTQLQSITDADLDGAQSYLRALQRKIQQEQAKLNQEETPTPTSSRTPSSTKTPKH